MDILTAKIRKGFALLCASAAFWVALFLLAANARAESGGLIVLEAEYAGTGETVSLSLKNNSSDSITVAPDSGGGFLRGIQEENGELIGFFDEMKGIVLEAGESVSCDISFIHLQIGLGNLSREQFDEAVARGESSAYLGYEGLEDYIEQNGTEDLHVGIPVITATGEDGQDTVRWEWTALKTVERNGWIQEGETWFFYENNRAVTGWRKINGFWYYMDVSGVMQTGWQKINGVWYFLQPSGAMKRGWLLDEGRWYYLGNEDDADAGAMRVGWVRSNDYWYHMHTSGAMQTGWQQIGGRWYYLQSSGAMQTGWRQINGAWYYFNSSGSMRHGWLKDNGRWYYLGHETDADSGAMRTGWVRLGGSWYHFRSGGSMQTGWLKDNNRWYFLGDEGDSDSGAMRVGWVKAGGVWYYMNSAGIMLADQWLKVDGNWYHLLPGGAMEENVEPALLKAFAYIDEVTTSEMTREQKLRACFDSFRTLKEKNPWIPHYKGMDWPQKYANSLFDTKSGNCLSYAAAFAYMAKALGYEEVYGCNSGGHGWVEINGLIYDPEWTIHNEGNYFGRSYSVTGNPNYKGAISRGYSWMRIRI